MALSVVRVCGLHGALVCCEGWGRGEGKKVGMGAGWSEEGGGGGFTASGGSSRRLQK